MIDDNEIHMLKYSQLNLKFFDWLLFVLIAWLLVQLTINLTSGNVRSVLIFPVLEDGNVTS